MLVMKKKRIYKLATQLLLLMLLVTMAGVIQAAGGGGVETDVTLSGGVLTITDVNGGSSNDNLTLSYAAGTYTLSDGGGLPIDVSAIAGSTGDGTDTVTFPDTGINGITFNILGGDDIVTVNSVQTAFSDSFMITGGTGVDQAIINAALATTGNGAVNVTVSGNILLNSGSSMTTVDGGIVLDANSAGTETIKFKGIEVNNAMLQTTGTGDIQLLGKGSLPGTSPVSTWAVGVYVHNGSTIASTATGATAGQIILNGVGGSGTNWDFGVWLKSPLTITSVDGNISIVGVGGAGGEGQRGIEIEDISVTSTGVGAEAATITMIGTAGLGDGGGVNEGIRFIDGIVLSTIETIDGDVLISGFGNGTVGVGNSGASFNHTKFKSTGTGVHAGTITIRGVAGHGASFNTGLYGSLGVSSIDGDIVLEGTGSGVSDDGVGVYLLYPDIESTGTGPLAATITISGTGSTSASSNNQGVKLPNSFSTISTVDGDLTILGKSNATSLFNHGVEIGSGLEISSTGTGPDAATITIEGTSLGRFSSAGVEMAGEIVSVDGGVQISGTSSVTDSSGLSGVLIGNGGIQVVTAPLTINGTTNSPSSSGVDIGAVNLISLGSGPITIYATANAVNPPAALRLSDSNIGDGTHVGALTPATGDITINADSTLWSNSGSIESNGKLILRPLTAGIPMSFGSPWILPETLVLTDAELLYLQDGFSSIVLGSNDAGNMLVDSALFNDSLTLLTGGNITDNGFDATADVVNVGNTTIFSGTLSPNIPWITAFAVDGDVEFADDSGFTVKINGRTTSPTNNKLVTTGNVTIGDDVALTLDLTGYTKHEPGSITIIDNGGSAAVSGTFSGLAEGSQVSRRVNDFTISYVGGDGNDVVLTYAEPSTVTLSEVTMTSNGGVSLGMMLAVVIGLGMISLGIARCDPRWQA